MTGLHEFLRQNADEITTGTAQKLADELGVELDFDSLTD